MSGPTRLIPVRELAIGDVLVTAFNTRPRTVTALRLVTTTAAGGARTRPPTQRLVSSVGEDAALYSDCQYLGLLVRVRVPTAGAAPVAAGEVQSSRYPVILSATAARAWLAGHDLAYMQLPRSLDDQYPVQTPDGAWYTIEALITGGFRIATWEPTP